MKYLLMMHSSCTGPSEIATWPAEDIKRHIGFMKDFAAKLGHSGVLVAAEGLAGPEQARRVKADKNGRPVTDGVFPESKEFLAGYWIVDVESPERAYEVAAAASLAPGKGGAPMYLEIEVRQVMSAPPADLM